MEKHYLDSTSNRFWITDQNENLWAQVGSTSQKKRLELLFPVVLIKQI